MKTHEDLAPSDLRLGFGDLEGLRKLAIRLVRDDAEADDVVQETLLLGLRRATGRVLDLGSWLRGVVRNKARESRRAAARRETHEAEARPGKSPMQPIDIAERVEVHDQLVAAVKGLGEPYRSAVWLHYVEGREAADVARDLAIPLETVRTHLKRGVAKLREDLDRRNGKRADWMPALVLFAGVQPSVSLFAATTTVAAGPGLAKITAAAAAVLVVAASAVLVIPRILDRKDEAMVEPSRLEREQRAPSPRNRDGDEPSAAKQSARDVAATGRDTPEKIAAKRFLDEDGTDSRGAASEGKFGFHYQQGFTFSSQTVSKELENADVVFKTCAGGISSVTLEAPGGGVIVNLDRLKSQFPTLKHAEALARAVVKAEPASFGETATAEGDDHSPASDAFLLRTRGGSWVVMAISARVDEGGWETNPVKIKYVINDQPVFRAGSGDVTVDGIEVDSQLVARLDREVQEQIDQRQDEETREQDAKAAPFREKLAELDRRAAALQPAIQARDGAPVRVAAVLDRGFAAPMGFNAAYVAATYSFEKATRDDVKATNNDWDFLFEQLNLRVNTVTDDQSRIWSLGAVPYRGGAPTIEAAGPGGEGVKPSPGCLYAIHTIDSDTDQWALMRIEELAPNESLIFSWAIIPRSSAVASGLELKEETPESVMQAPSVRLQVRGGARGGNRFTIALDGTVERGAGSLSKVPLDLQTPLTMHERHVAYASAGKVPVGKVFLIERIEYVARVEGDTNGDGLFLLRIGQQPIVCARGSPNPDNENWWYALDRGRTAINRDSMPLRGDIALTIPVPRGSESRICLEISNSCWADVTLSGRLLPAAEAEKLGRASLEGFDYLLTLKSIAETEEEAAIMGLGRSMTPEIATGIRSALDSIPGGAWRSKVSLALDQAPK